MFSLVTNIGFVNGAEHVHVNSPVFDSYFDTPYIKGLLIQLKLSDFIKNTI